MEPLTIITLVAAITSITATVLSVISNQVIRGIKLQEAQSRQLEEVLRRNELKALAVFLDQTVGQFDVSEYVTSPEVTRTINRYLDGVVAFLGTNEEVEDDEKVSSSEVPLEMGLRIHPPSEPLADVISYLDVGEVWNALALLRRIVEIELRRRGHALGYKDRHLRSAGQMLRLLADREEISSQSAEALQYAISVCNRAVHGRDVTMEEARKAFLLAERWLDGLIA